MTQRFPFTDPASSLSDEQIREVMRSAYHQGAQPAYLQSYAAAIIQAPEQDFLALRLMTVFVIRKYQLWKYLQGEHPPVLPATIEGDLAKRRLAIVRDTCHGCGHVHREQNECGEDLGSGRICRCESRLPATAGEMA
jgi:hypothetical protein